MVLHSPARNRHLDVTGNISHLLTPDTMKFPVPDLAVEALSQSTEARDRGVKLEDFSSHGVAEYWIIDADEMIVEW